MDKETWKQLTDKEKTDAINLFLEKAGLKDFDYAKERERYESLDEESKKLIANQEPWEHPVVVLESVGDPIIRRVLLTWLFSSYEYNNGLKDAIPFGGFICKEVYFDKSSLMHYSDEEKEVLNKAIEILKSKGL